MAYILTDKAKDREPIIGVEWRDYEDREFAALDREYAARNGFPERSLHGSGYWEHVAGALKASEETPATPAEEDR